MSKNQIACCPGCSGRLSFKKFVELNNFSVTNCDTCNARIEISNRTANGIIAAVSGIVAASCIVMGAYIGARDYESMIGGLLSGTGLAALIIISLCRYAYRHSQLNRINLE
jgi:Na+-driven multidrug efflux pump